MTSAVTSASVLGHPISFPLCIAPTGYQAMAHPDAETAVARGVKYRHLKGLVLEFFFSVNLSKCIN